MSNVGHPAMTVEIRISLINPTMRVTAIFRQLLGTQTLASLLEAEEIEQQLRHAA
jgi:hypothetical protein